jgi:hypothetical protein
MTIDFDHIRRFRFAPDEPPKDWPPGVRVISQEGLTLLGIHEKTNRLYWDGQQVALTIRLRWFELTLAIFAAVGTFGTFAVEAGRSMNFWK